MRRPHRLTRALDVIMTRSPSSVSSQGPRTHTRPASLLCPRSLTANAPGNRSSCRFLTCSIQKANLPLTRFLFAPYSPDNTRTTFTSRLLRTKKTSYYTDAIIQYADLQHADDALSYDPLPLLSQQGAHIPTPALVSIHDDVKLVRLVIPCSHYQRCALPTAVYLRHGGGKEAVQRRADGAGAATHRLLGRARGADLCLGTSEKDRFKHSSQPVIQYNHLEATSLLWGLILSYHT